MQIADFKIRMRFFMSGKEWMCTDVGTRVIVAVIVTGEDPLNLVGTPYSIVEHVIDEDDLNLCNFIK